ncbi:MAG: flagellar basal body rod protein FlgB [Firmicutes bacterium]|nr:flagellar basal body rod protein FlgB [Bacillota bacterium]
MAISDLLMTPTTRLLEEGLGASFLRQKVISNNLANAETPGFKRSMVSFENELKEASSKIPRLPLTLTHPKHISNRRDLSSIKLRVFVDQNTGMRNDNNNVDVESEMAAMTSNELLNQAIFEQLSSYYSRMRTIINEGR